MKDRIAAFLADLQVEGLKILASVALILALFGLFVALYIWWKRRYTRERYAFAALTATVGLVFTALSVVVMPNWLEVLAFVFGHMGITLNPPRDPTFGEKILVVAVIVFAIRQINKNHQEWEGAKSAAHRERDRLKEDIGLVQEGLGEIRRMLHREPAPVPIELPESQKNAAPLQTPTESLSWHEQVYELLRLSKPSYYFDRETDWHDLEGCWVGRNTKTKRKVAVLCLIEPSETDLQRFATYCQEIAASSGSPLLFVALPSSSEKIQFDSESLGIKILLEEDLLKDLIDFSSYKRHIQDRFTRDSLQDSSLTLSDVYVSASATHGFSPDEEAESVTVDDMLFEWASEESSRQIALLGDYGQGKSTCALAFTHRLLTEETSNGRIPLLIELRGKSPSTLQPLEFLGAWSARFGLDPQALSKLISAGKTILIFEGFDEMAYVSDSESRVQHLQALWRFCYPRAKLLFTGRRNFFFDDRETLRSLGIGDAGGGPYCEPFHLLRFSSSQISETLEKSGFLATEEIFTLGERSESFKEVITRPSTLYMISLLWRTESETLRTASTSAEVMQLFINSTYMRQAEKQRQQHLSDRRRFMMLTVAERNYFMMGVAAYMAAKQLKNQITRHDLEKVVEHLYSEMPDQVLAKRALPLMDEPSTPLKERVHDRTDALEAVQTDVRTYGLLVRDPSRQDAYQFPHKSYFEILYAEFAHLEAMNEDPEQIGSVKRATGVNLMALSEIPEAIQFLGDLISSDYLSESKDSAKNKLFRGIVQPRNFAEKLLLTFPKHTMKTIAENSFGTRIVGVLLHPAFYVLSIPFYSIILLKVLTIDQGFYYIVFNLSIISSFPCVTILYLLKVLSRNVNYQRWRKLVEKLDED